MRDFLLSFEMRVSPKKWTWFYSEIFLSKFDGVQVD
ncbi:hypothetical protein LSS_21890 [Leptospira santarosai serovar Shermani str. LT 821]|uniref:Uncharacterized protein n=1 Tax=Leptospira santarosai serovar Shermani str. LT 821 TaxID=758847 RepID=A0A097ESL4_9LEPT|nr:hypothetical protein LSS_21890 [Leptospira santarosai serovar Shermani str. LT 821]